MIKIWSFYDVEAYEKEVFCLVIIFSSKSAPWLKLSFYFIIIPSNHFYLARVYIFFQIFIISNISNCNIRWEEISKKMIIFRSWTALNLIFLENSLHRIIKYWTWSSILWIYIFFWIKHFLPMRSQIWVQSWSFSDHNQLLRHKIS